MAPVIKWQRWDSASYDWFGTAATDALPSLEAELDAWITAVNGNASNVGRQLTKERGYADSTSPTDHAGFVVSAGANGNTEKGYIMHWVDGSTSSKKVKTGDTFVDDSSNSGYGTISGGSEDSGISFYTSGLEANWLITYDTTDGEEYFTFGPRFGSNPSSTYADGFLIMKCSDGEWALMGNDGTSYVHTHYFDDAGSTGWNSIARRVSTFDAPVEGTTYTYSRFAIEGSGTPVTSFLGASMVYAANKELMSFFNGSTVNLPGGRKVLTDLGDGTNVYLLTAFIYGPVILVDLRP